MAKLTWWRSPILLGLLLAGCAPSHPPKPFSWEVSPTQVVAEIDEMLNRPVLVRFLNSASERSARIGTVLRVGESMRTDAGVMGQVVMNSGAVVRIGEKSAFTLKSPEQVRADNGKLLVAARRENGRPLTKAIEVQTPFGTVSSANAVMLLGIPTQPDKNRTVFVLEGNATVKLRSGKSITLRKGDELQIKPDGTGEKTVRPSQADLESRFAKNDLLFGFATRFAGQSLWERQLRVARREITTVRFRSEDYARNRPSPARAPAPAREPIPYEPLPYETFTSEPEPLPRETAPTPRQTLPTTTTPPREPVRTAPPPPTITPEVPPPPEVVAPPEPPPVIAPEPLPVVEPPAPELPATPVPADP